MLATESDAVPCLSIAMRVCFQRLCRCFCLPSFSSCSFFICLFFPASFSFFPSIYFSPFLSLFILLRGNGSFPFGFLFSPHCVSSSVSIPLSFCLPVNHFFVFSLRLINPTGQTPPTVFSFVYLFLCVLSFFNVFFGMSFCIFSHSSCFSLSLPVWLAVVFVA